jgi:hypothetical protein
MKVHIDGSPQQSGAVSLSTCLTGSSPRNGFGKQTQSGEHRQDHETQRPGFPRNAHCHPPTMPSPFRLTVANSASSAAMR